MKPVRVLLAIDSLRAGGAERQFAELVRRLDPERVRASVLLTTGGGPLLDLVPADRLETTVVLQKHGPLDLPRLALAVRREIARLRPDVVHAWLWQTSVLAALALAGTTRANGPRFVVGQRVAYDRMFAEDGLAGWVRRPFTAYRDRRADLVLVNARLLERRLAARLPGGSTRVRWIPNGIDVERVRPRETPMEHDLCAIGRLAPQKGFDVLLEALAILSRPDARVPRLAVAGDGPMRESLVRRAAELGLVDRVDFLGFVGDPLDRISRARALVLPSRYEGSPNAVLEAMALARPVVASAVDGVLDLVRDGETGFLVPPEDPRALAEAIARLLADPQRAEEMGRTGRARAERAFSIGGIVEAYARVYETLAASGAEADRSVFRTTW
ncbi:MAG: glycosyltransferase [Planctomycetes bacterium]|nr:glycosyltransferase [Planctomycetota bacterium]